MFNLVRFVEYIVLIGGILYMKIRKTKIRSTSSVSKNPQPIDKETPKLSRKQKDQLLKSIRSLDEPKSRDLDELFKTLTKDELQSLSVEDAKCLLKEKDISLITHALTNHTRGEPRPDQRSIARMVILTGMSEFDYSPASLLTHGGRVIFDCRDSDLASMQTILISNENSSFTDITSKTKLVGFSSEETYDQDLSKNGAYKEGITTRKSYLKTTFSSHSLVTKSGKLKERKHGIFGSGIRGTSTSNPEKATLFQQHLGLSTGDQSGKQGSLIVVTDKDQKNFMVGIEGASYSFGSSDITNLGHAKSGKENPFSAFNQVKKSKVKKIPGFEDFPGKLNEARVTLTNENVSNFKLIDDWINSQSAEVRLSTLTAIMQADNASDRHKILTSLVADIKQSGLESEA